jgi:hypothetical protein
MSVAVPSGSLNDTDMPRTSGALSGARWLPPPLDQRTTIGTLIPWRWPAVQSSVARGVAVKVPA